MTQEGVVSKMLESEDPAMQDMLAVLVNTFRTTELVPGHWRAGYTVNISKKSDKEDIAVHRGVTLLNVVTNK